MAKVIFQDEQGQNLNRYVLTPVEGQANTYDLTRAATITQQGTPYNKEVGDHFLQAEDGTPVQTLACSKTDTVYALTGLTATAGKVPVIFSAPAAYAAGDTMTIDGTAYALTTRDGSALTAGAWVTGKIVTGIADVDTKTLTVEPSAPAGALPATTTRLPNPAALSITTGYGPNHGSSYTGSYDGSSAKAIQIPKVTISTAAPTSTLDNGELWGVY